MREVDELGLVEAHSATSLERKRLDVTCTCSSYLTKNNFDYPKCQHFQNSLEEVSTATFSAFSDKSNVLSSYDSSLTDLNRFDANEMLDEISTDDDVFLPNNETCPYENGLNQSHPDQSFDLKDGISYIDFNQTNRAFLARHVSMNQWNNYFDYLPNFVSNIGLTDSLLCLDDHFSSILHSYPFYFYPIIDYVKMRNRLPWHQTQTKRIQRRQCSELISKFKCKKLYPNFLLCPKPKLVSKDSLLRSIPNLANLSRSELTHCLAPTTCTDVDSSNSKLVSSNDSFTSNSQPTYSVASARSSYSPCCENFHQNCLEFPNPLQYDTFYSNSYPSTHYNSYCHSNTHNRQFCFDLHSSCPCSHTNPDRSYCFGCKLVQLNYPFLPNGIFVDLTGADVSVSVDNLPPVSNNKGFARSNKRIQKFNNYKAASDGLGSYVSGFPNCTSSTNPNPCYLNQVNKFNHQFHSNLMNETKFCNACSKKTDPCFECCTCFHLSPFVTDPNRVPVCNGHASIRNDGLVSSSCVYIQEPLKVPRSLNNMFDSLRLCLVPCYELRNCKFFS